MSAMIAGMTRHCNQPRFDRIIEHLSAHGEGAAGELAALLGVSLVTVRRDLAQLEQQGRVTRTHGGAVLSRPAVLEFAYVERGAQCAAEKQAIARAVASVIPAGSTLALDSGTTTLEVARAVSGLAGLTVLTSSLAIASVLYAHENIETVLLGGTARKGSPDLSGWLTTQNLKEFHVDYAVVGADGVTAEGAYTKAVDLARVCRAVLDAGTHGILAVDHRKIGMPSFCRYAPLDEFGLLVTDSKVARADRRWLNRLVKNTKYVRL